MIVAQSLSTHCNCREPCLLWRISLKSVHDCRGMSNGSVENCEKSSWKIPGNLENMSIDV